MISQKFIFMLALLGVLSLSGCRRVDLHHNLLEIEADEILVSLQQNGIEAKKEMETNGQDVSWKVSVSDTDGVRARQVLISNNLPKRRELGLSGVYKEKGLIPTPDEQKARFLLATKGEIINSLKKIPGVVDADVVLNVPSENEFSELDPVKKRPTASVVVRIQNNEEMALSLTEGKIQRFVANTVPNLDANNVAVIVTRADVISPSVAKAPQVPTTGSSPVSPEGLSSSSGEMVEMAGIRLDQDSVGRFRVYMVGLLLLLVAVSSFLLFNIVRLNRLRLRVQTGMPTTRAALASAGPHGLLAGGGLQGQGEAGLSSGVEGTFNVGATRRL